MSERLSARKAAFEKRRGESHDGLASTYYLDAYVRCLDRSPLFREASAFCELLTHVDLPLRPEEEIVGYYCPREPVTFYYGFATSIDDDLVRQVIRERNLTGEALREFEDKLDKVREHAYRGADPTVFSEEELASIRAHAATSTWFGGHMVLDYDSILRRGLNRYQSEIDECREENPGHDEFYAAMETMLKAIQGYIHRYAEKAARAAEDPAYDTAKFNRISRDLLQIAHGRPQSFHQALQLLWILHTLNGADSFGRFDQYLWEFYRRDLERGVLTKEAAFDEIGDFFVKIEEANQIQNMTIGGTDANGAPCYNDLTELCLRAAAFLKYKGPNLCLRVSPLMPREIWSAAMDALALGLGIPALYNEGIYADVLLRHGFSETAAHGFCLAGCSQLMIPGESNFYNDVGVLNAAKVLELALYNGFDERTGCRVGPETGDAASLTSFARFYAAVNRQLDYFCDLEISINDKDVENRAAREGYAMRTLFIKDCIRRAKPVFDGGARYNAIELEVLGITNLANSVYAVKKFVYERGEMTLPELVDVLRHNFEGRDDVRQKLLRIEKFGNDCEELDLLRGELSDRIFTRFNRSPTRLGGISVPGEVIFTAHEYAGFVTGATPDGRLRGTVLADSAGSAQGQDLKGPTALLNSVLKIPVREHLLTTIVLNVKFSSVVFAKNREKIQQLFEAFFARGGMQLQINVADRESLEDAMLHPEKYRSLIVRVGGYSDYFVNLTPALQSEILARTSQSV